MRFRIGVNVGDVIVKDGDISGDGVNVAARLEGLVNGGEVCVSRGVRDYLRYHPGMGFEDLGEQLVKEHRPPDPSLSAAHWRGFLRARPYEH
jgi:class 3 adenylate cyclase